MNTLLPFSEQELNERAAAAVTSYGLGTRSYNQSAEKREMDRQRAVVTEKYESQPRQEVELPLLCFCAQREFPHELSVHWRLRVESFNPDYRRMWPWSLMLSDRVEPSTEGMSQ